MRIEIINDKIDIFGKYIIEIYFVVGTDIDLILQIFLFLLKT
jgi:hypothetical protein